MTQVFISHSSKDRQIVERDIIAPLRANGIKTWYSTDNIRSAGEWEQQIREGLSKCDWVIVALTPQAIESEWVKTEVHWALDKRKGKVIPVMLEDCEPSDLHLKLQLIQHIDFCNDTKKAQQRLLLTLGLDVEAKIADESGRAREALNKQDWATAIVHLENVLRFDPTHDQAQTELELARRKKRLAELYAEGLSCFDQHRWKDALTAWQQVWKLDKDYREIAERIAEAYAHLADERSVQPGSEVPGSPEQPVITGGGNVRGEAREVHQRPPLPPPARDSHSRSFRIPITVAVVILVVVISYFVIPRLLTASKSDEETTANSNNVNAVANSQNANVPVAAAEIVKTGDSLFEQQKYAEAEREYRKLVAQNPNDVSAQLKLGKALFEQKKYDEAREFLQKATQLSAGNAEAHAYYGRALIYLGNYKTAEKELREATQLEPNNADYHYYLGVALSDQDKLTETEKEFSRALQLGPADESKKQMEDWLRKKRSR